jgi:vitamin B12 transporter
MEIMLLFYSADELVVSATRSLKPINKVAENITMLTHRELEAANAHTLLDVLRYVTGVQTDILGGPFIPGSAFIQGSDHRHVLVLVDDVPMNNLSDNIADLAAIPAQHIERIEIIKGPASSAWGSSLGGVINVITKSPTEDTKATTYVSMGDEHTRDIRVDLSGKDGRLGYYLYGGVFETDGLLDNMDVDVRTVYSKLELDLTKGSRLFGTYHYSGGERGLGVFEDFDLAADNEHKYELLTLGYRTGLPMNGNFELSYRKARQEYNFEYSIASLGLFLFESSFLDEVEGASAKLVLQPKGHVITVGGDYDYATLTADNIKDGEQSIEKQAVYLNDSITMGPVTVTPGLRYDESDAYGDFTSPSLGIAYAATDGTVLRAAAARGFNAPPFFSLYGTGVAYDPNPDLEVEKVWSYQLGAETTDIPHLWAKITLFRHDIEDGITDKDLPGNRRTAENKDEIRRQGLELELATEPVFHTSLLLGYAYIDIEDLRENKEIKNRPRTTADAGLQFEAWGYRATLKGHYIDWNTDDTYESKDDVIWGLFLNKQFGDRDSGDVFIAVHNIFDGEQYSDKTTPNPERWIEGGVRFRF